MVYHQLVLLKYLRLVGKCWYLKIRQLEIWLKSKTLPLSSINKTSYVLLTAYVAFVGR